MSCHHSCVCQTQAQAEMRITVPKLKPLHDAHRRCFTVGFAAIMAAIGPRAWPQVVPPDLIAVCAPCHGFEGIGKDVEIPNLAGQHDVYLANQLRAFRSGRRKHTDMHFIARELTDGEIERLATYFSKLSPR
jgi:cytochrome c553